MEDIHWSDKIGMLIRPPDSLQFKWRVCRGDADSNFDSLLELLIPSAKNTVEVFGE